MWRAGTGRRCGRSRSESETTGTNVTRVYITGAPAERLQARLRKTESGCVEYDGHRDKKGYGRLGLPSQRVVLAHRLAFELEHGTIPAGLHVLHRCDNPPCCNVAHLFLGTLADNNRDMWEKGRGKIPHRSGERANNVKLTAGQVDEIRRLYVPRVVTCKMLAADFGVTHHAIQAIVSGRNWKRAA